MSSKAMTDRSGKSKALALAIAAAGVGYLSHEAKAATPTTWKVASGSWDVATNWAGGVPTTNYQAIFYGTPNPTTVTVDGGFNSFYSMIFYEAGVTINPLVPNNSSYYLGTHDAGYGGIVNDSGGIDTINVNLEPVSIFYGSASPGSTLNLTGSFTPGGSSSTDFGYQINNGQAGLTGGNINISGAMAGGADQYFYGGGKNNTALGWLNGGTITITSTTSTYTGLSTVQYGTLQMGNSGAAGSILDNITVRDNGVLAIGNTASGLGSGTLSLQTDELANNNQTGGILDLTADGGVAHSYSYTGAFSVGYGSAATGGTAPKIKLDITNSGADSIAFSSDVSAAGAVTLSLNAASNFSVSGTHTYTLVSYLSGGASATQNNDWTLQGLSGGQITLNSKVYNATLTTQGTSTFSEVLTLSSLSTPLISLTAPGNAPTLYGSQITNVSGTPSGSQGNFYSGNPNATQTVGNNNLTVTNTYAGGYYQPGKASNLNNADPTGKGVTANSTNGGLASGYVKLAGFTTGDKEVLLLNITASSNGTNWSEATTAQLTQLITDMNAGGNGGDSDTFTASTVDSAIHSWLPLYNLEITFTPGSGNDNGYAGWNFTGYSGGNGSSAIANVEVADVAALPEPASTGLVILGGLSVLMPRRRKQISLKNVSQRTAR